MEVFDHHIYEFKKGLRNLILHTTSVKMEELIKKKLDKDNITYLIYPVSSEKINVLFGNPLCIEVLKVIDKQKLNELTDEEDFMIGTMLGYGMIHQCERYLKQREKKDYSDEIID